MHIIVLAGFLLTRVACQDSFLDGGAAPSWRTAVAVAVYVLGAAALTVFSGYAQVAARGRGRFRGTMTRLAGLTRLGHYLWLIGGSVTVVLGGYGRWVLEAPVAVPMVAEAAVVGPFVVALLLGWMLEYAPYCRLRQQLIDPADVQAQVPVWTWRGYVGFRVRSYLLFIAVPLTVLTLAVHGLGAAASALHLAPWAEEVAALGVVLPLFVLLPLLLVRVLNTAPMPSGPQRDDLEHVAEQLGFTYRDIRVWRTGGVVANAAVMGLLGYVRYVLVSDAVLAHLDSPRVCAIFAHEAGHARHHHLPFYGVFVIAAASLLGVVMSASAWLGLDDSAAEAVPILCVTVAWVAGFGWISRRFERQCDVTAAWAANARPDGTISMEGAAVFSDALQRLTLLNGRPPRQRSFMHGSVQSRADHLYHLADSGRTRYGIDRTVRRIKVGLLLAAIAGISANVAIELMGAGS